MSEVYAGARHQGLGAKFAAVRGWTVNSDRQKGRIIAGNKTVENAGAIGLEDVVVVPVTGNKIVAVQRMDLDLEGKDTKARELALADNRSSELKLDWNQERHS